MKHGKTAFIFLLLFWAAFVSHAQELGDVNHDNRIDIIDALFVARHYVGFDMMDFYAAQADVDCSSTINIVDALLIARFYVGLVVGFECDPVMTPDPKEPGFDVFGIKAFYPTKAGSLGWDSRHWNNGINRTLSNDIMSGNDPEDPSFWSEYRGSGVLTIDGQGQLSMGGTQPRIYINPYPGQEEENPQMFFKNVEATVYFTRIGSDGANWGGCIIGARSGPNGHSSWGDYCDATTYYARLRYDGHVDFYKELKHPDGSSVMYQEFWDGAVLPADRWIGVKFCVYNVRNDSQVKLELYVDRASGGSEGGNWELAIETVDDGSWQSPASGCNYPETMVITRGGGVVFIRNTDAAEAHYKWFSVREIDVFAAD
ncbi:MAG: hypothetical protein JXR70_18615 [Spirochaetales bacterium]|nr:hypothetical protein [Spirochaetales bacterium]